MTISLYCRKPGLKGGSKRQMRVSLDRAMFSLAAAARSCAATCADFSGVALPRKEVAMQVSASRSRKITCGSSGCGKCPKLLPDGMTKETNHSLALFSLFDAITGAVIAIFSCALFPLEIYRKRREKAALLADE